MHVLWIKDLLTVKEKSRPNRPLCWQNCKLEKRYRCMHTHIRNSTHTHIKDSPHTHIKESTHMHIKERHIRDSTHAHIKDSTHKHIKDSTHAHNGILASVMGSCTDAKFSEIFPLERRLAHLWSNLVL